MKIKKTKGGSIQRQILTAMITNRKVLAAVASRWEKPGLFSDKFGNLIGEWCINYYNKYEKTPGIAIQTSFEKWAAKNEDEVKDTIGSFLSNLSEEFEARKKAVKADYIIDEAQQLFKKVQIKRLRDALDEDIQIDDIEKAFKRLEKINPVHIDSQVGIDVLSNTAAIHEAMDNPEADILIRYPGAVGNFFEDIFSRGHLVAFMAPEKTGKTFSLIDVAWRGAEQDNNVAFFAVGDMNQKQMMRRIFSRIARRPFKPGKILLPTGIDAGDPPIVQYSDEKVYTDFMSFERAEKAARKMKEKVQDRFKLFTYPNSTININGIKAVIDHEKRKGWVADIVVIDYADILAPLQGASDTRDQINATWKGMRALAHNMLVVTATQSDAASYGETVLGKKNFSEDKRKLAHANGIIGINVTDEEKEKGLRRFNFVVARENEFVETKCVYAAGCLGICDPIMFSTF